MEGIQGLSLDDPIYSIMIGDQAITITLANILEVGKLRNEVVIAEKRAVDLEGELTAVNEKLAEYWTKILEGKVIIENFKKQLGEEKEITKRLMKALEEEIGWRGMIGVKHHLLGKFAKEMGKELMEMVGDLAGYLKEWMMLEGDGGGGSSQEEMDLEILTGIPVVLKSLKRKVEDGVVSEREEIIRVLGVMKEIIKRIGGDLEDDEHAGSEHGQGQSSAPEEIATSSLVRSPENAGGGGDDDWNEYETYIEVVEDEDEEIEVSVPVPPEGEEGTEEPTTSSSGGGAISDLFGFQVRETTSGGDEEEPPAKKGKRMQTPTKAVRLHPKTKSAAIKMANSTSSTVTSAAAPALPAPNEIISKHAAHPKNKRMCLCGFTTHVTNLNKHIWRLGEGRHTTRGPHVCPKCLDRFKTKSAWKKHVSAHTDGAPKKIPEGGGGGGAGTGGKGPRPATTFTCTTCSRIFPNRKALYNHRRRTHHPRSVAKTVVPVPKLKVAKKGKATLIGKVLPIHVLKKQEVHQVDNDRKLGGGSHFSGHFCKCGNQYFTRGALIAHVRKNTQELQFKCDLCEQRFLWNSLLVQHLQRGHKIEVPKKEVQVAGGSKVTREGESGAGVKIFTVSCSFCGETFSKYDELYKHRKVVHGIGKKST